VARLALLSLLAVFRDLLPGYRIRSLTEEEQQVSRHWRCTACQMLEVHGQQGVACARQLSCIKLLSSAASSCWLLLPLTCLN